MQLHNPLSEALTIVGLSADCCAIAILHQMRRDGDKLMMQHLDQLPIAAHETAQLAPGGMHIMLMNSKEPLKHGSRVTITFNLADGRSQSVVLGVKKYEP